MRYIALVRNGISDLDGRLDPTGEPEIRETGEVLRDIFSGCAEKRILTSSYAKGIDAGKVLAQALGIEGIISHDCLRSGNRGDPRYQSSPQGDWSGPPLDLAAIYELVRESRSQGTNALVLATHIAVIQTFPTTLMDAEFPDKGASYMLFTPKISRGSGIIFDYKDKKWRTVPRLKEFEEIRADYEPC